MPLLVWRPLAATVDGLWPGEVEIWTEQGLVAAIAELRRTLYHQAVVWVEGEHLPATLQGF